MPKVLKVLLPYVVVFVGVLLIKAYIVTPIRVNGPSMMDTLHDKDIMLLDEISYRFGKIERFDIVVIKHADSYLIKRVIGLPGEEIRYQDNILYVNGEKVAENFSHRETEDFSIKRLNVDKIPEGYYFVLGDNRTNSTDSRHIGLIKKSNIKGKAFFTLYPFNQFGFKK